MRANSLLTYVIIHFHEWHFFHNFVSYLKPSKCILRRYSPFQSYGLPPFRSLLRATLSRLKTLLKVSKTIVITVNSRHSSMFPALISSPEPRTSSALPIVMAHQVRRVSTIDKDEIQVGDLVFFGSRKHNIGHVGIVCEVRDNGNFKFIHSSCKYGVTISNSEEGYYAHRYRGARRILEG